MIRERQFEVIQQVNHHLYCSICREVFYNPIRATCGHTFCGTCLVRWIQMKKSCPLCRHKLERNYQFDKDILATKLVGDVEVRCLRCLKWEGTLAQFKPHKKSQCTFVQVSNDIPQDAIEIGDNDNEFTFAGTIEENDNYQINENIGQAILVSIEQNIDNNEQNVIFQEPILNIDTQDNQQDAQLENNVDISIFDNNENQQQSQDNQDNNEQIQNEAIQINIISNQNPQQPQEDINEYNEQQQQQQIQDIKKKNKDYQEQELEIQVEEPAVRMLNNKEIKEFKAAKKLRINILRNAVKVVEPHIEQIDENLFIQFVEQMKKEMIKRLSDKQYYNTLIG